MVDQIVEQMNTFFEPKAVAIIGASRRTMKAGHVIFKNFATNKLRGVFKGALYPINPNEDFILGFKCYPSITEVPGGIELVIIIVPAPIVPTVMEQAAAKKVQAAIIISAGFKEVGNIELEQKVVAEAEKAGVRILGPNCLGVYYSKTGVDSLFLPETKVLTTGEDVIATPRPMPGNIAMITQSGAFGVAALDYLTGRQMGVSKFVSYGNKCDVAEVEILNYLLNDKETRVILAYVEDIKAGRDFLKVARKVTTKKPIVVIKSGKSSAGARAASSHTGAIAGSDKVYAAAFEQAGIIRARDMEEFFDAGKALTMQPPALGRNIGILTDAGGPGVMTVDELENLELTVEPFSEETLHAFEKLKADGVLLKIAATNNPVDLTGSVTDYQFEVSVDLMLQDPKVDGVIFLGLHHMPGLREKYIDSVAKVARKYCKPIVMCDIGETEMALYTRGRFDRLGIPSYSSPEDAARAMKALVSYGGYLQKNGCAQEYLKDYQQRRKP